MTYFLLEYEVRFPQKVYIWILEHFFSSVLLTAINRQSKVIHLAFLHSKIFCSLYITTHLGKYTYFWCFIIAMRGLVSISADFLTMILNKIHNYRDMLLYFVFQKSHEQRWIYFCCYELHQDCTTTSQDSIAQKD